MTDFGFDEGADAVDFRRLVPEAGDDRRVITIRKSTPEERAAKSPPIVAGGSRCPIPKWVVVWEKPTPGMLPFVCTFGMPDGGATRAEAVFWAERKADRNDLHFYRPPGWENIEGSLP